MGKPGSRHGLSPAAEHIGSVEGTRGSETSQYPQEEKTIVIPLVVASERGLLAKPYACDTWQGLRVWGCGTNACGAAMPCIVIVC